MPPINRRLAAVGAFSTKSKFTADGEGPAAFRGGLAPANSFHYIGLATTNFDT